MKNIFLFFIINLLSLSLFSQPDYDYESLLESGIPLDILYHKDCHIELPLEIELPEGDEDGDEDDNNDEPEKEIIEEDLSLEELLARAYFSFRKRDYQTTFDYLERADKLNSNHHKVKKMKGSLYYKLGFLESAKENWEKSLEIRPSQPDIKGFLNNLNKTSE